MIRLGLRKKACYEKGSEPRLCAMDLDLRALFANLAEKEKIKGHHSPEGRAIRTVGRALDGWSSGSLSDVDVVVLCDQAMEDWLKARLNVPAWSHRSFPALLQRAVEKELLGRLDAVRLQKNHKLRARIPDGYGTGGAGEVENVLEFCIQILEKHW